MNWKVLWDVARETLGKWQQDNSQRLAAALAYYAMFSLAPLFVIIIAIAGFVLGRQTVQQEILSQINYQLGKGAADFVQALVANARNQNASFLATGIGLVTLLFGAAGVFNQLQTALNAIWDAPPVNGGLRVVIKKRLLAFLIVAGIGLVVLAFLLLSSALSLVNQYFGNLIFGASYALQVLNVVITFAAMTLLFAMLFKILPDTEINWKDVWLGAIATAILFTLGNRLIALYLGFAGVRSTYGAAGSLVAILLWVYYSAQILFLGAEFTQVYASRFGEKHLAIRKSVEPPVPLSETPQQVMVAAALDQAVTHSSAQASFQALTTLVLALVGFIGGLVFSLSVRSKHFS